MIIDTRNNIYRDVMNKKKLSRTFLLKLNVIKMKKNK